MIKGWITYDNRTVTMEDMSHQHMSNIFYFVTYVVPNLYPDSVRNDVFRWLVKRFSGDILPYRPHPGFKEEKQYLLLNGYLKDNNDIIINNQLIGKYK